MSDDGAVSISGTDRMNWIGNMIVWKQIQMDTDPCGWNLVQNGRIYQTLDSICTETSSNSYSTRLSQNKATSSRPEGAFSKSSEGQNSRSDLLDGTFLGDVQFILVLLGAYYWVHMLRSLPDLPDQLLFEQLDGAKSDGRTVLLAVRWAGLPRVPRATLPIFALGLA